MFLKILGSRKTTMALSILLLAMLLFGYGFAQLAVRAEPSTDNSIRANSNERNVVYFIPQNSQEIESELSPNVFSENAPLLEVYGFSFQATSDWSVVRGLASKQALQALIIHRNAVNLLNTQELVSLFRNQRLVVTSISIPGYELAELLGQPSLFTSTWSAEEGYATSYYFYTYSYNIQGGEVDIKRLEDQGWQPGQEPFNGLVIENPLSVSYHASTDSLLNKDGIPIMLSVIHSHVLDSSSNQTIP